MSDAEKRPWRPDDNEVQAYIDDRLEPDRRRILAEQLARHPDRAAEVQEMIAQRDLLRCALESKLREPVPPQLRVQHLIRERARRNRRGFAMAASVLLAVGIGAGGGWLAHGAWADRATARLESSWRGRIAMATSAHEIFVADAFRPVEIFATAGDVVVRWLSNRLGRPVAVPDLDIVALRFLGGRLIPTTEGPAAQLMFDHAGGTRLTLFMVPAAPSLPVIAEDRFAMSNNLGTVSWADARFRYTVVGSVDQAQLQEIARAIRAMLPPGRSAS